MFAGLLACGVTLIVHHGLLRAGLPMTHEADAFVLRVVALTRALEQRQWAGRWIDIFAYEGTITAPGTQSRPQRAGMLERARARRPAAI